MYTWPTDTTGQWAIDGVPMVVPPQSFKVGFDNVVSSDSGRTEDGVNRITWLRRCVTKLEVSFPVMSASQASTILAPLQGQEVSVTYPDAVFGLRTIDCYVGASSYEYYGLDDVRNVAFNIVEK